MTLAGGLPLWQIYSQIPHEARAVICQWSSIMARGMENTEDLACQPLFTDCQGVKLLERKCDYDLYCYYVAGTVGHMITGLVISHYSLAGETAIVLSDLCKACGRGLQKTNIVKDFKDESQPFPMKQQATGWPA